MSQSNTNGRKKLLVILDISGVFCCKAANNKLANGLQVIQLSKYSVYIRPGVKEFIDSLLKDFNVGIWSSTTYHNANQILKEILSENQRKKLRFIWYRDRTELDPEYGVNKSINSWDTIKDLNRIWYSSDVNRNRRYNKENTLIIDDDYKKLRYNPPECCLVVNTFDPFNCKEDLTDILRAIKDF